MKNEALWSRETILKVSIVISFGLFLLIGKNVHAANVVAGFNSYSAGNVLQFGYNSGDDQIHATRFVPTTNVQAEGLYLWLGYAAGGGAPADSVKVRLCTWSATTTPCGSEITNWQKTAATLTTTAAKYWFNSSFTLTKDTAYALEWTRTGAVGSTRYISRQTTVGSTTTTSVNGLSFYKNNGSWSADTSGWYYSTFEFFGVSDTLSTLSSISPTSAYYQATNGTLTVTGTGFAASDTIRIDGADVSTTFVSSTEMTAHIPNDLTVGTHTITVYDLSMAQVGTGSQTLTINAVTLPSPNISATGTSATGSIVFSGNFSLYDVVGNSLTRLWVEVAQVLSGAVIDIKTFDFTPPSPTSRFEAADLGAQEQYYPAGTYIATVYAQSASATALAFSNTVMLGSVNSSGQSLYPDKPPYTIGQTTGFNLVGAGTSTGSIIAQLTGSATSTSGCGVDIQTVMDASSTAAYARDKVICALKKWQSIGAITWVYGLTAAVLDAKTFATAQTYTLPIGLPGTLTTTYNGASYNILDSSSSSPEIISRLTAYAPNYYTWLTWILWAGFAIATVRALQGFRPPETSKGEVGTLGGSLLIRLGGIGLLIGIMAVIAINMPPMPVYVYDGILRLFGYMLAMNSWIPTELAISLIGMTFLRETLLFTWYWLIYLYNLVV